jgi:alkylation response protein AidB-like acyl-CoA dehydrogenase
LEELLVEADSGRFLTLNVPTEADYLTLWREQAERQSDLLSMALAGGLYADRLAWVFIAGYQAAIRCTFPEAELSGWAAFAVTEDRQPDHPLPGVTVQDGPEGQVLNGHKTWVAAAEQIDQLIVKAGRGGDAQYFLLDRAEPGLELSVRPAASFLSELSQGAAHLNGVSVTEHQLLDASQVPLFGTRETLFIFAAFCAFVLARSSDATRRERCRSLMREVPSLLASRFSASAELSALKQFDADVQQLLDDIDNDPGNDPGNNTGNKPFPLSASWPQDRRLISMYSKGIQARRVT